MEKTLRELGLFIVDAGWKWWLWWVFVFILGLKASDWICI